MNFGNRKRRTGTTLIETVLSMGIGSIVMLLAIKVLHQSYQLASQTRLRHDIAADQNRIGRQFRTDAVEANRVVVNTDGAKRELQFVNLNGSTITYRDRGGYVHRVESRDAVHLSQERYRLAQGTYVDFDFNAESRFAGLAILVPNSTSLSSNDPSGRTRYLISCPIDRWIYKSSESLPRDSNKETP